MHVVVAPLDVILCEVLSTSQLVDDISRKREQILVLDGDLVELPVILNEPELAILFFDEKPDWTLATWRE